MRWKTTGTRREANSLAPKGDGAGMGGKPMSTHMQHVPVAEAGCAQRPKAGAAGLNLLLSHISTKGFL